MIGGLKRGTFIAMDIDGDWFAYPSKPEFDGDMWRFHRADGDDRDVVELSPDLFELPKDTEAANSLYEVP